MTEKVVAVLGTLDTKGAEYAFLKRQIEAQGVATLVIDVGILAEPPFKPEVSAAEVASLGGGSLVAMRSANDRGSAVATMARGAAAVVSRLQGEGRIHGIVAMGGGGGTSLGSAAMQALPVGFPKLLISTLASGDISAIVGV